MRATNGLREQLTRLMAERHVPGLQAVVMRHGEVVASVDHRFALSTPPW